MTVRYVVNGKTFYTWFAEGVDWQAHLPEGAQEVHVLDADEQAIYESGALRDLGEVKDAKIAEIDAKTMQAIMSGFDYDIGGVTYHFGYDKTDQENFTAATLAATLSIISQQPFVQPWRGWVGDVPHEITLNAQGMVALATFAGKTHKQGLLASGWALTNAVRTATTIAEVEAIVDDRQ